MRYSGDIFMFLKCSLILSAEFNILSFAHMMKLKLMTVLFLLVVNSASAQVVWGMFPSYKCQVSRENTSKVKLTTNRLKNFQIVMDDSIDLTVIGFTRSNRFTFKNVPAGDHHFVVSTDRKGFYTEPFNHSFSIQTEGNGDTYLVKLPKRKLRTAVKVVGGVTTTSFLACFVALMSMSEFKY